MLFSFLVTLREGFEVALIIAIVLGYLARTGNRHRFGAIWVGTGLAVAVAVGVAMGLELAAGGLSGVAQEAFEGAVMLAAVAVLTWMVLWVSRQSATIGRELRSRVDIAIERGSLWALAGLTFSAVLREGIETVLFLFAGSTASSGESDAQFWAGGVAGFAVAASLGYLVYRGSTRLPLSRFFTVTGVLVLVIAAGLLSNGVAELQESGLVPNLGTRPWDTDAMLSLTTAPGKFLHTLLGYDPAPTWGQIALYWGYLAAGLTAFLALARPRVMRRPSRLEATSPR